MKNNLEFRKKLQICRAHLTNVMEEYLSHIINQEFSDLFSAEFVVKVSLFTLSQRELSFSPINSSLFMYPTHSHQYEVSPEILEFDGAIDMQMVRHTINIDKRSLGSFSKKLIANGFEKATVYKVYDVLRENGIDVLLKKIKEIQNAHGCFNKTKFGDICMDTSKESDASLMQCMLDLIAAISPDFFASDKFQTVKTWILSEQHEEPHYENRFLQKN